MLCFLSWHIIKPLANIAHDWAMRQPMTVGLLRYITYIESEMFDSDSIVGHEAETVLILDIPEEDQAYLYRK